MYCSGIPHFACFCFAVHFKAVDEVITTRPLTAKSTVYLLTYPAVALKCLVKWLKEG